MEMNRKVRFLCHSAEHSREDGCAALSSAAAAALHVFTASQLGSHSLRAAVSLLPAFPTLRACFFIGRTQAFAEESHQVLRKQRQAWAAGRRALKTEMAIKCARASDRRTWRSSERRRSSCETKSSDTTISSRRRSNVQVTSSRWP